MRHSALWTSVALVALVVGGGVAVPSISNFRQSSNTLNTVTVEWELSATSPAPTLYTLTTNDFLENQFIPGSEMVHIVSNLLPCTSYSFRLEATFPEGTSLPAETEGTTEYSTPGGISGLAVTDSAGTVTWSEPPNAECVDHYSVCWRSLVLMDDYCTETSGPSLSLDLMSGCDSVKMEVQAVNPDGRTGPEETILFDTAYADPGAPVNFTVTPLPGFAAKLSWDLPEENPACIERELINYGPVQASGTRVNQLDMEASYAFNPLLRADDEAVLFNLTACTNYLFGLSFESTEGAISDSVEQTMETDYVSPMMVENVQFTTTQTEMKVMWANNNITDHCLDYIKICYTDQVTHEPLCVNAEDPAAVQSIIITGLSPCRHYEVIVSGVSITGEFGPAVAHDVRMQDTAPGPVTNLVVDAVTTSSILVSYDPPVDRAECAYEYRVSHKLEHFPITRGMVHPRSAVNSGVDSGASPQLSGVQALAEPRQGSLQDNIIGLESCSLYRVEVYAVSASNQAGQRQQVQERTDDAAPMEPTDLKTITKTTTSISTAWFAPSNRYCVDWYKIQATHNGEPGSITSLTPEEHATEQLFTTAALVPCTSYTITVTAGNDLGVAAASYEDTTEC